MTSRPMLPTPKVRSTPTFPRLPVARSQTCPCYPLRGSEEIVVNSLPVHLVGRKHKCWIIPLFLIEHIGQPAQFRSDLNMCNTLVILVLLINQNCATCDEV